MRGRTQIMPAGRGPVGPAGDVGATGPQGATGANGPQGDAGVNAYSTTIGSNKQPAVNSSIDVRMSSNGTWATVGQIVYVAGGGHYEVLSPAAPPFVTLKNLGYSGNAAPGATLSSGSQVSPAGPIGATGATGAGAYVDFELFAQSVTLTEGTQQWTKGWGIFATASGRTCTGARVRLTSAAGQTYKIAIYDGSSATLLDSSNVVHSAGTSSHTVTWASPVSMVVGRVYYVTMYCTTAAKDCTIQYSSDSLHGPKVYSEGQRIQIADGVWVDKARVRTSDGIPNSDSFGDFAFPLSPIIG